jgi:hypothetical protein
VVISTKNGASTQEIKHMRCPDKLARILLQDE